MLFGLRARRMMQDGTEIGTYVSDMFGTGSCTVEAGTSGYGRDGGARTYFSLRYNGAADVGISTYVDQSGHSGLEIFLTGDAQMTNLMTALRLAVAMLKDGIEVTDE